MTLIQAIILAIVEGLTEFLPVSSTAHMKFTNPIIGVHDTPFTDMFEIVIQLAAILAVVVVYYKKFFDFSRIKFYIRLIVAVIPAIVIGGLFKKKYIDPHLDNLTFIACVMVAGGILFLFIDRLFRNPKIDDESRISYLTAFKIGCFQVLSIVFPGLSRSASTILGGMSQGMTRKAAAEFSFFLAVPTMLAASVKSFWDVHKDHPDVLSKDNYTILGISSVITFVVAIIVIRYFIDFLKKHGFRVWGYYRIVVGLTMLILLWRGIV